MPLFRAMASVILKLTKLIIIQSDKVRAAILHGLTAPGFLVGSNIGFFNNCDFILRKTGRAWRLSLIPQFEFTQDLFELPGLT